eukprot:GDKJ01035438.1.p1 GENE.GDKJ01035438.1~~GDKJ01035438.1.p1  ORF type:complete len:345 (-),score=68.62 GDKJ01035438.1:172-1206(-)
MQGTITCPSVDRICSDFPCANGGHWSHHLCVCPPGFIGRRCEFKDDKRNRALVVNRLTFSPSRSMRFAIGQRVNLSMSVSGTNANSRVQYVPITCLPIGMQLDSITGVISGIAAQLSPCQPYTIASLSLDSANNLIEEARAVLYLEVVTSFTESRLRDSNSSRRSRCALEADGSFVTSGSELNAAMQMPSSSNFRYSSCVNAETGSQGETLALFVGKRYTVDSPDVVKTISSSLFDLEVMEDVGGYSSKYSLASSPADKPKATTFDDLVAAKNSDGITTKDGKVYLDGVELTPSAGHPTSGGGSTVGDRKGQQKEQTTNQGVVKVTSYKFGGSGTDGNVWLRII